MSDRFYVCGGDTLLDLAKVCAVLLVRKDPEYGETPWVYSILLEGGHEVVVGDAEVENTRACHDRMVEAWKNFVNGRT